MPHRTLHLLLTAALLLGVLLGVLLGGCADRACEHGQPSAQIDLELDRALTAEIQVLWAEVTAAGRHKAVNLDTGSLKENGRASFVVEVGSAGAGGFDLKVSVQALAAGAALLALGEGTFSASGDACNRFSLRLSTPATDGGPRPDGGVPDTGPACGPANCLGCCQSSAVCAPGSADDRCGTNGAACVDCTQTAGTCESGACTNCTPTCTGKLCGASDGCGGTCQAGSGCCTPACTGKLCGASDGCGATCQAGSGCTPAPDCVGQSDASTLLLYTFEGTGTTVTDVAGSHNGSLVGTAASRVTGKSSCGKAISFSTSSPISYLLVPDSTDWDLSEGSIDFWVRFDGAANGSDDEGIASRDANSALAGHLSILRMCNGSIMARLQDTSTSWAQCSDPVGGQVWHHIGLNFGGTGGLKLYVDGTLASRTASISCAKSWACGSSTPKGIAGNNNPWTLGAESWLSTEGSATPVGGPLKGRIDSFRISKVRRSF